MFFTDKFIRFYKFEISKLHEKNFVSFRRNWSILRNQAKIKKKTKISIYYQITFVSVSYACSSQRSSCSSELVEFVSFVGEIVTFIKYLSGQIQFIFLFEPLYRNRGADASLGSYQCPRFHHKINRRRLTYPIVVFVGARRILTSRKKI